MSSASPVRVLIVCDVDDPVVRRADQLLREAGALVERFTDVYEATLRLAADEAREVRLVLVDQRAADTVERRFLGVARRSFPWVISQAIAFETGGRLLDPDAEAGLTPEAAAGRVGSLIVPEPRMPVSALPRFETDEPSAPAPLLTDLPEQPNEPQGLAADRLHEAVRDRMRADAGVTPARRTPPGQRQTASAAAIPEVSVAAPPEPEAGGEPVPVHRVAADDHSAAAVTPAELDALLGPDGNGDAGGGRS